MRDRHQVTLPAEQLVPGDVVHLCSGDRVPADLRLIHLHNLGIDEASLTGESVPVNKNVSPVSENTALGDRGCMAYSGTLVTSGQAEGVVVATGQKQRSVASARCCARSRQSPPHCCARSTQKSEPW